MELVTAGIREVKANSVVTEDGWSMKRIASFSAPALWWIRVSYERLSAHRLPGHDLHKDWAKSAEAHYGVTVSGYPNLYMLVGPNTGLGHNSIVFMIECQVKYILQCMALLREEGADYLDVKPKAQEAFNANVQRRLQGTTWTSAAPAGTNRMMANFALWPGSTWRYWLQTCNVRSTDYEFVCQC